ncbi:hypothetical protein Smp_123200 [Schistosoma mansoni]|uniref:hypothetical protein n=1 Tax=Schistosoma mansoni TaxID=6183 RepID=UPI0001A63811|nr:hypothetical protein Smp_123200 [Schistosoma mansoni]|eukprot:XP_018652958.1 hypothetical protein Smp_123200 [Schistosoma mansoni]
MKETTVMHHYHHPHPNHRLLTVISAIVLLTIVHDVKGSGLFDDDISKLDRSDNDIWFS